MMSCKTQSFLMPVCLIMCGVVAVLAQQPEDEQVRGAFLSTRAESSARGKGGRRRRAGSHKSGTDSNANSSSANSAADAKSGGKTASGTTEKGEARPKGTMPKPAIGLGYTVFARDSNGDAVRTDPTREFHNDDRIRISLEPNIDGYLYIFHSENDGPPEMIFPDVRLESGDNSVEAHVPFEVPSSQETNERRRWFTFYGNAGTERLYIVLASERLKSIPTGDELVAFCSANKDKCPWHPAPEAWAQVKDAMKLDVKVAASTAYGSPETAKEKEATTRGLGLDESAPAPSVIRMNASTNAPILVTVLDLIHK
jgi:hypothetical protein